MKFFKVLFGFIVLAFNIGWCSEEAIDNSMLHYYCVPSDMRHYHMLKNFIGSVHYSDYHNLGEIAVFDLGLSKEQKSELNKMEKVKVYSVEMVHKDLLTFFKTHENGRKVRGNFAWKPVVIKQALEMFPYVLYCDAGTTILKPMDVVFKYIQENAYFLISCTHCANCNMSNRITQNVIDGVISHLPPDKQEIVLSEKTYMIDAGLQGVSREMMDDYVMPMYEYAKNIELFRDDGTAIYGFGAGRHDQTLFSIVAHSLGLYIYEEGYMELKTKAGNYPVHVHWDPSEINERTYIYHSRHDIHYDGGRSQFVKYRK